MGQLRGPSAIFGGGRIVSAPALFHESIADALREVVHALGGTKAVGTRMRPEKGADAAGKWVSDCLNLDRAERFDPEQVLWILRAGRKAGAHAAANYLMREAGYADPVPVEPEDERARLERDFLEAAKSISKIADRLARIGQRGNG
jgi:hypothetical protein